jgi:CRISPR-associated endonuclease/helicase Cas3
MTFEAMFRSIHGYDPFPWQSEAARKLIATEDLLSINVPTASGKTALIDAAVYAAAYGGPRKIAFIIDRRVVVDEAYLRARRIAAELANQDECKALAQRLGPVHVVRLRGGVHGDDDWVIYPDRTTIIISTVDQIGSRLMHRGYGVSPRMAPMHAGFVGNNVTFIIDEAHLSVPFIETVQSCRRYGADIRMVSMTATPIAASGEAVKLSKEDGSHPILCQRLQASKKAQLIQTPASDSDFVKTAAAGASGLATSGQVIGVVVNRVGTARRIWQALSKQKHSAILLTGRVRPYDRDQLMKDIFPRIRAGRIRKEDKTLFVVATQTVEVGADIDFDALVTEAAPLDAIRQRFGRLDRLGELGNSKGIILYREPKLKQGLPIPDPIYGMGIHDTWKWLQDISNNGFVDFGINALEQVTQKVKPPPNKIRHAPVLLPAHIKLLSQTGPDAPHIDVAPWLHGAQRASSDVTIVWRADFEPDNPEQWQVIGLRPPFSREALEIPVYTARTWLQGKRPQDITDLEGMPLDAGVRSNSKRPILRWRGLDDTQIIQPDQILPGDTLVVPSAYGGCDRYGWNPTENKPVNDIADLCSLEGQGCHSVRLVPGLTDWLGSKEKQVQDAVAEIILAETMVDPESGVDQDSVQAAHSSLRVLLKSIDHPLVRAFHDGSYQVELHPKGVVLHSRTVNDIKGLIFNSVAVSLPSHLEGVALEVSKIAADHPNAEQIVLAAAKHDIGKEEPRFQIMLHGDPLLAAAGPALAKSGMRSLSQRRAAYKQSGIPRGFRHELASIELADEQDLLVRHLIATHHGFGRPWFPVCEDSSSIGAKHSSLDSGWCKAFADLRDRYGPWALTGMELLLRAADVRQSISEQEG